MLSLSLACWIRILMWLVEDEPEHGRTVNFFHIYEFKQQQQKLWQLAKQADFPSSILFDAHTRTRMFMKSFDGSKCERSECRRQKERKLHTQNFTQK